jgi:Protein of unknown function (DUF541)
MNKYQSLSFFLLIMPIFVFAQTPSFLEFTVTESITLQAKKISYQIRASLQNMDELDLEGADFREREKRMKTTMRQNEEQLKQFLTENKITYQYKNLNPHSVSSAPANTYFELSFNSKQDLEKVLTQVRQLDYIEGYVGDIEYDSPVDCDEKLFEKAFQRAKKQAAARAKMMGCTLGKLVESTDVIDFGSSAPAYYNPEFTGEGSEPYEKLETTKTLNVRFKFALECQ